MTKRALAEQIFLLLYPKATKDAKTDLREIITAVGELADSLRQAAVYDMMKMEEYDMIGDFITYYDDIAIEFDASRNQYFSYLPAQPLGLPNNMGVWNVCYQADEANSFVPATHNYIPLYSGLQAYTSSRVVYKPIQNKIYYTNISNTDAKIAVSLIASAESIGEREVINCPTNYFPQIIQGVLEIYKIQKGIVEDLFNNEISE